jgi:hypothetical protein
MNYDGIAFWGVLDLNQTMNAERYKSFLEQHVTKWASDKGVSRPVILHDNARPHKAKIVQDFIKEYGWTLLPHPILP